MYSVLQFRKLCRGGDAGSKPLGVVTLNCLSFRESKSKLSKFEALALMIGYVNF